MKIVFQAQATLSEIASEAFVAVGARPGTVFFRPLSAPGMFENRIDIAIKSGPGKRTYPYKRAEESVK